ncbi:hypothetical protein [Reyranella sp.]|uniref:hypothetical protein n=1 Tax=Reyranella sp. TaxID=1929291 RepID=UPI003BAA588C
MRSVLWVVVLVAALSSVAGAKDRSIRPLPDDQCVALAQTLGSAAGIPLSLHTGVADYPAGLSGEACLMTGTAIGLTVSHATVQARLDRAMGRWRPVPALDADGPDSTTKAFVRDNVTVIYSLAQRPPLGTCEDVVQADCKVPRRHWHWTLDVTAFVE